MPPPEPPPSLTRLEELLLDAGYDIHQGSFDGQCERIRAWLRGEIAKRLREVANGEPVEVAC